MSEYKYLLFDLDGTLTESHPGIVNSVIHALRKQGRPLPDEAALRSFVGPPLVDSFMRHCGMTREEAEASVSDYREYFHVDGWKENAVYEGIPEVLGELKKRGRHLFVATSKPEEFAKKIADYFGFAQYFDQIIGATMDGRISTKGQVIACVLEAVGQEHREEMVMIGDREHDVLGAKEHGLPCVGVLYGYGSREELLRAGAAAICPSVRELPEYL